jgi:hypothetical protein
MFLAAFVAAAWACPEQTPADELGLALEMAMERLEVLDDAGFVVAVGAVGVLVPCLSDSASEPIAAALHRVNGLHAFVRQDVDAAVRSFAAARALEPDHGFPEGLFGEQHPLWTDYFALELASVVRRPIGAPRAGVVQLDGAPSLMRAPDLPVLFQRLDESGDVMVTRYVGPGESLPEYDALRIRSQFEPPLLVAAISGVVAGGALLAGAAGSRAAYDRTDGGTRAGQAQLDPLRARTNGLLVGGAATTSFGLASAIGFTLVVLL